jgi:hypothetical protein
MKGMLLAASLLLAACGAPRITPTAADPRSIQLLVQNARLVPSQDVDERALRHCSDYGLVARQAQVEWTSDTSMTYRFDCVGARKPTAAKPVEKKANEPPVADVAATPPKAAAKSRAERKQAAWAQAHALSQDWLQCMVGGATQRARTSADVADAGAIAVVAGCARWERDVHEVLRKAGEDDSEFQDVLHKQTIEFAAGKILAVRAAAAEGDPVPATSRAAAR